MAGRKKKNKKKLGGQGLNQSQAHSDLALRIKKRASTYFEIHQIPQRLSTKDLLSRPYSQHYDGLNSKRRMNLDLQYITTEQLYYISQEEGNTNIVLPQFNS